MITKEQLEARTNREIKEAFANFMQKPTIRLLISTIPETGQETLTTLLLEAYTQAWTAGQASFAVMMLERTFDPRNFR
jgi:hypothetical protein